jgi:hypothetical protein
MVSGATASAASAVLKMLGILLCLLLFGKVDNEGSACVVQPKRVLICRENAVAKIAGVLIEILAKKP